MAFWSNQILIRRIQAEAIISDFDPNSVKFCAYELKLGEEVFITSSADAKKQAIQPEGQIVIPPGQFALLITREVVTVPRDAIAFISIKAGIKFSGLINVSGFHVDPGFNGRLKFSVYNAGGRKINLTRDKPCFLIFFADLNPPADPAYQGEHQGQMGISSKDVMDIGDAPASPSVLDERLKKLETQVEVWTRVAQAFSVGVLLLLLALLVRSCESKDSGIPKPSMQTSVSQGSVTVTQRDGTVPAPQTGSPAATNPAGQSPPTASVPQPAAPPNNSSNGPQTSTSR